MRFEFCKTVLSPLTKILFVATHIYTAFGAFDVIEKFNPVPLQIVRTFGLVTFGVGLIVTIILNGSEEHEFGPIAITLYVIVCNNEVELIRKSFIIVEDCGIVDSPVILGLLEACQVKEDPETEEVKTKFMDSPLQIVKLFELVIVGEGVSTVTKTASEATHPLEIFVAVKE